MIFLAPVRLLGQEGFVRNVWNSVKIILVLMVHCALLKMIHFAVIVFLITMGKDVNTNTTNVNYHLDLNVYMEEPVKMMSTTLNVVANQVFREPTVNVKTEKNLNALMSIGVSIELMR